DLERFVENPVRLAILQTGKKHQAIPSGILLNFAGVFTLRTLVQACRTLGDQDGLCPTGSLWMLSQGPQRKKPIAEKRLLESGQEDMQISQNIPVLEGIV